MSEQEEMLSDDERLAMLTQVFKPTVVRESKSLGAVSPGSSSSPSPDVGEVKPKDSDGTSPSSESFGSLLEKTLVKRQKLDETEHKVADEDRKHAIEESRKDLIGDMVKTFFKC